MVPQQILETLYMLLTTLTNMLINIERVVLSLCEISVYNKSVDMTS